MAYVFLSQPCSPPLWCENAGWASAWRSRAGDLCLHSRVAFELSNTRPLPDDNRQHQEKDNGLYDTEYPDIDFIVRYTQQVCTIYQYSHTPIKKAIDKLVPASGGYLGRHHILQTPPLCVQYFDIQVNAAPIPRPGFPLSEICEGNFLLQHCLCYYPDFQQFYLQYITRSFMKYRILLLLLIIRSFLFSQGHSSKWMDIVISWPKS